MAANGVFLSPNIGFPSETEIFTFTAAKLLVFIWAWEYAFEFLLIKHNDIVYLVSIAVLFGRKYI